MRYSKTTTQVDFTTIELTIRVIYAHALIVALSRKQCPFRFSKNSEQRCYFPKIKKSVLERSTLSRYSYLKKGQKMAGESLSERHVADRQRKHAQRAMHAGEMSSFPLTRP